MKAPLSAWDTETIQRKARLARRRSPMVWPDKELPLKYRVLMEARHALRVNVRDYWDRYRRSQSTDLRAKFRSYVRAQITALRILEGQTIGRTRT